MATLAAVYGREIVIEDDDEVADTAGEPVEAGPLVPELEASGWTYHDVFVLHDRQTGSLWYPYPDDGGLKAINGPLAGRVLETVGGEITTLNAWVERHPHSLVLSEE